MWLYGPRATPAATHGLFEWRPLRQRISSREKVLKSAGAKRLSLIEQLDVRVTRAPEHAADRAIAALQRSPMVEYAQFDTVIEIDDVTEVVPNDPWWAYQWGLKKVEGRTTWAHHARSSQRQDRHPRHRGERGPRPAEQAGTRPQPADRHR